jgi:hypothetical protein
MMLVKNHEIKQSFHFRLASCARSHSCKACAIDASSPTRFAIFASNESVNWVESLVCSAAKERARVSNAGER